MVEHKNVRIFMQNYMDNDIKIILIKDIRILYPKKTLRFVDNVNP